MAGDDKAAERTTLILKVGRMFAPLHAMANRSIPPADNDYRVAGAAFSSDSDKLIDDARKFTEFGAVAFQTELTVIVKLVYRLRGALQEYAKSKMPNDVKQQELKEAITQCESEIANEIDAIPIGHEAMLLAEGTPFTTHLKINDVVRSAKTRVHYFDRYVHSDFFPLYVRDLPRAVEIKIVTTAGDSRYGVTNVSAIAKLAAKEFSDLKLIQCMPTDLHDRNLRIDEAIFTLGTSISSAGNYPTNFAPAESSPAAHAILDSIIASGTDVT